MKKTNSAFVFGALVVASFAAVRCGGDDSNSATTTGTAGSGVNTGGSAGSGNTGGSADTGGTANNGGSAGSANTGGANNGGTANNGGANNGGTANNGGANNGGSANPTDGGGGTAVGAGGTQVGGDAGMCPAMAPMNMTACTGNVTCDYPSNMTNFVRACSCLGTGPRVDGGARSREWNCGNVFVPPPRDAGPAPDAGGRCPIGTNDGDNCTMAGEVCRLGNNGGCACVTFGNETTWFCN